MDIWDYGDGSGVSVVQLQHMMRGSECKIYGKIKSRYNVNNGDVGENDSGRVECGFNEYVGGEYVVMK